MDIIAAKKLFMDSHCSTFVMGRDSWPEYLSYMLLNISREQENSWRFERVQQLKSEYIKKRDYQALMEMYDLAEEIHSESSWQEVRAIIPPVLLDSKQNLAFIESIIGRKSLKMRSGYLFWTASLGKTKDLIYLFEYALTQLEKLKKSNKQLEERVNIDIEKLMETKTILICGTGDGPLSQDENRN